MKHVFLSTALFVASAISAQAATLKVTNLGDGTAAYAAVDPNLGTDLQPGVSLDALVVQGNIRGVQRSPYDNSGHASVADWQFLSYFVVGPRTTGGPATLTIANGAKGINLLWGSIDSYNFLEFFSNGVSIGKIGQSDITPASTEGHGTGASYVQITSDSVFDEVKVLSSSNAFEFANVSVAPVPLPAGALLLLGGLGGLAAMRRRKG